METPEIRRPVEKTTWRKVEARIMEKNNRDFLLTEEEARIGEKAGTSLAEKERRSATEIDGKIWQPKQHFLEDEKSGALNTLAAGVSLKIEGRSNLMETSGSNSNEKGGSLATGSMEIEVPPFLGFSSTSIHGGRNGVSSPHDFNISEFLCLANKVVDNGDTGAMEALEGLKNRWEEKYDNGGSKKSATNLPFGRNPIKARRGSFSPAIENENSALAGSAGDEETDGWFWQEHDEIWGELIEKNDCISDDVITKVTFADVMANVTPTDVIADVTEDVEKNRFSTTQLGYEETETYASSDMDKTSTPSDGILDDGRIEYCGEWSRKTLVPCAITRACTRLDFARICVMIDVTQELTKHIIIMTRDEDGGETPCKVDVEYEWLPPKCTTCMTLGHTVKEGKAIILYNAFDTLHLIDDADETSRGPNTCNPDGGLNKRDHQLALKDMVSEYRLHFLGILET
ncbi:UNVERIFIED_CONTAM: hypothetical protein Sindi_2018000 [Sesamum indicum]